MNSVHSASGRARVEIDIDGVVADHSSPSVDLSQLIETKPVIIEGPGSLSHQDWQAHNQATNARVRSLFAFKRTEKPAKTSTWAEAVITDGVPVVRGKDLRISRRGRLLANTKRAGGFRSLLP